MGYFYRLADSAHGHVGADLYAVCVAGTFYVVFKSLHSSFAYS